MKIMFHCWEFPPNGTGVAAYIAGMSAALVSTGHQVVIATGKAEGCPEYETGPHGEIHRFYDRSEAGSPDVATRVLDLAGQAGVDWIEGSDHLGETASLLAKKERPPVVVKTHSSRPLQVLQESEIMYPWQRVLQRIALFRSRKEVAAEWRSLTQADLLLCPSERLKQALIRQDLTRADKIIVIPNPVRLVETGPAVLGSAHTILFVGRLSIEKGIQYLPRIFREVLSQCSRARLEIAGADGYARFLGSLQHWLSRQFGPNLSRVSFLGPLAPHALEDAYKRASVLVVPSRWDNFPNVVLEAMVRGIPVVASLDGGMPEMLEGTGCPLVNPATPEFSQSIINILGDQNLQRQCAEAGRRRALEKYHPEIIAKLYIDEITRALNQNRPRSFCRIAHSTKRTWLNHV